MIIRGTTPTLYFTLPFDTELLEELYVTIVQNEEVIIDKPMDECECNGAEVIVKLTQEETLKLESACCVGEMHPTAEIQIRVKTKEGEALASDIKRERIYRILKDGVI